MFCYVLTLNGPDLQVTQGAYSTLDLAKDAVKAWFPKINPHTLEWKSYHTGWEAVVSFASHLPDDRQLWDVATIIRCEIDKGAVGPAEDDEQPLPNKGVIVYESMGSLRRTLAAIEDSP